MDKLICIGKNYLEHARELGDAVPELPVLFLKPPSVLTVSNTHETLSLPFPQGRGALHHECEIVVKLSHGGSHLTLEEAKNCIGSVSLGLDMTLRDLQATLKKNSHPWEVSKVFAGSAVIGPWQEVKDFTDYESTEFSFSLNGVVKQKGTAQQMRLSIAECISYASQYFPLIAGDLVFTGTPAGVGAVNTNDHGELLWGDRVRYSVQWKD